jgi:agmatine deiminase
MPAEWSFHRGTWLAWPSNEETWPNGLERVQDRFVEIIALLAESEKVFLLVDSHEELRHAEVRVKRIGVLRRSVEIHVIPTADAWIRDYGPNFLVRTVGRNIELACNDWVFNAWGDKYPELAVDGRVPAVLSDSLKVPRFEPGIVLEGGSIDVNGGGICLTTRQCLLNPNRNPQLTKEQIEAYLTEFLGIHRVIWLNKGIAGEDTDGHIDNIARFVNPNTVVTALEEDSEHPNFPPLQENCQILTEIAEKERLFRVATLPTPEGIDSPEGPLPASYANFYIGNKVVLVPTFNQDSDQLALDILGPLFLDRRVIGVDCTDIIQGMGAIHCLTQQQPYSGSVSISDMTRQ